MTDPPAAVELPLSGGPRRAVVGVILRKTQLLVIERSRHVRAPGKFCFPGGGIEAGESEEVALLRELHEELGVRGRPQRRMWQSVSPWGVELAWWRVALEAAPRANPHEVAALHWLSLDEMAALPELLESNRAFLDAVDRGEVRL